MSYFQIQHNKRVIYIKHAMTPYFTWRWAEREGLRFPTASEAQAFIHNNLRDLKDLCMVVESK